jgi:hypothetical protein
MDELGAYSGIIEQAKKRAQGNLASKYGINLAMEGEINPAWREEPVDFYTFVRSPGHMGQPRLSKRQWEDFKQFLGEEPEDMFFNPYNKFRIAVLLWGKGSGKDWICSMLQCWVIYLLLCLRDPHVVIGLAPNENIDVLNCAYNKNQAREVYFTKFIQRIKHWKWLYDNYLVFESGILLNPALRDKTSKVGQPIVKILEDKVLFPHVIRAISTHAENESWEGFNIFFWVMDEAAAFKDRGQRQNAVNVYSTLRTSAESRFPTLWRGVMISFPRSEDDFMMQMYAVAKDEVTMFASKGCTWEINPMRKEEDFMDSFRLNPVDARSKYMCDPPPQKGAFLDPDKVDSCFIERTALIETSDVVINTGQAKYIGKVIDNWHQHGGLEEAAKPRVAHVDGGLKDCSAGLIVAHGEPSTMPFLNPETKRVEHYVYNKVIIDFVLEWRPDPGRRLLVSMNNIASILLELNKGLNLVRVTYDQWNSQSSIEALQMAGVPVEEHNISIDDYSLSRDLINLSQVDCPKDFVVNGPVDKLKYELKKLVLEGTGSNFKVVPGAGATKDLADCVAGVARLLNDPKERVHFTGTRAPRIISKSQFSAREGMFGEIAGNVRRNQAYQSLQRVTNFGEEFRNDPLVRVPAKVGLGKPPSLLSGGVPNRRRF